MTGVFCSFHHRGGVAAYGRRGCRIDRVTSMAKLARTGRPASRPNGWLIRYPRAIPLGIFLAVMMLTGFSIYTIERAERESERTRGEETARIAAAAIERRGDAYSAYLRAGSAILGMQDSVDREEFASLVSEMESSSNLRVGEGFGWAPVVPARRAAAFEREVSEEIGTPYLIRPIPARTGIVVPVLYFEPETRRSRSGIGFNLYAEPTRRKALEDAVAHRRPTASGRIELVTADGPAPIGFTMVMPAFAPGAAGAPRGFLFRPFDADRFLESAVGSNTQVGNYVALYDGEALPENLLAQRDTGVRVDAVLTRRVSVASRPMTVEVGIGRGGTLAPLSLLTLLFGLAVATLLTVVTRLLTQQASEDERRIAWYDSQNSIRNSLTRELNHRVKNTLANVLSIIALTRRRADDLDSFADSLTGRIRALSATHDLLTASDWGTTPIGDVVRAELAPYDTGDGSAVEMMGPPIELAPNDALSLGLALHELATNAAKYGALSVPGGQVCIRWERADQGRVAEIRWEESGGPAVPEGAERDRGFGLDLLEKIVAHELRHPVDLEFAAGGVRCRLMVPVRERGDFAIRADRLAV